MMIILIFMILSNISLFEIHEYDLIPNEDLDESGNETYNESVTQNVDETVDEVDYEKINFNQTDDYF